MRNPLESQGPPHKKRGWSLRTRRRWRSVRKWLLRSRRWAAWARRNRIFRDPPTVSRIDLPQFDDNPDRPRELEQARRDYQLVRIAEKLDLAVAWDHRTVASLPRDEAYTKTILLPKLALVVALSKRLFAEHEEDERWASLDQLEEAYLDLDFPPVRDYWRSDVEFARLRVHGPNPVWLRGGWDRETLLKTGLTQASAELLELPADPDDERWQHLYAVDYHSPLIEARPTAGRYLYPCIALFETPAHDPWTVGAPRRQENLMPIAIQLRLDGDTSVLVRPADGHAWSLAKVFFGSADIFVHEVISHWMWTHVVAEKFIIHTARHLSWRHPLRRMLAPHLTSTLAMNFKATGVLVGNDGTFDKTFAGAAVKVALVEYGDANWTYPDMIHAERVRKLRIDQLAYHPFRDDGRAVWAALEDYVADALSRIYKTEEEFRNDHEVAAWSRELVHFMKGRDFKPIDSLAKLQEVVTAIIFNPVHHALVNSLQFDVFGWVPLSPPTVPVAMPRDLADVTEETLLDALPSVNVTLDTIRSTYGFSALYDSYGANLEAYHEGWGLGALRVLRRRLDEVAQRINEANLHRSAPFRVGRPDLIGNSIDA